MEFLIFVLGVLLLLAIVQGAVYAVESVSKKPWPQSPRELVVHLESDDSDADKIAKAVEREL